MMKTARSKPSGFVSFKKKNIGSTKVLRRLVVVLSTIRRNVVMNDENTLRKAGAKTDPYAVFAEMIGSGHPPGSWDELLREVTDEKATQGTPWRSEDTASPD